MIIRNEIPILEYDDSSTEVITPDHDWTAGKLPEKKLTALNPGGTLHITVEAQGGLISGLLLEGPAEVIAEYQI